MKPPSYRLLPRLEQTLSKYGGLRSNEAHAHSTGPSRPSRPRHGIHHRFSTPNFGLKIVSLKRRESQ